MNEHKHQQLNSQTKSTITAAASVTKPYRGQMGIAMVGHKGTLMADDLEIW